MSVGRGGSAELELTPYLTPVGPFDVQAFLMNYIMIPIFILLAAGYKLVKKTKWVDLATADLVTGRRPYRAPSSDKEGAAKRLWANTFG